MKVKGICGESDDHDESEDEEPDLRSGSCANPVT